MKKCCIKYNTFLRCQCCKIVQDVLTNYIICKKICIMLLHKQRTFPSEQKQPIRLRCSVVKSAKACVKAGKLCYNLVTPILPKNSLAKGFFWYNVLMEYITVVIDSFWLIMEQITQVIVPIFAIILLFTIVKGLLFNDR